MKHFRESIVGGEAIIFSITGAGNGAETIATTDHGNTIR